MGISAIELFEILKAKLGETEARHLVQFVEHEAEEAINKKRDIFLTK